MIADRIRMIQAVSGGGGGFNPSQLSGLKLWLKADAGVTVDGSGNVSSWADQSGNGLDAAQSNAAKRPVFVATYKNGLPAIKFTGTQILQGSASLLNPECTAFLVVKHDSSTQRMIPFNLGDGGSYTSLAFDWNTYLTSGGKAGIYKNNASFDTDKPTNLLLNKEVLTSDNRSGVGMLGSLGYRFNGTVGTLTQKAGVSTVDSALQTAIGYYVGAFGSIFPLSGYITEAIVFARILSVAEIEQVEGYLARYDGPDPYYETNSLVLNMQGAAGSTTFTDESPNAFTVTPYGNAQLVSDATFGTVASFDGDGDYLETANASQLNLGTSDFTVECWFKLTSTTNNDQGIINDTKTSFSSGSVLFKARQASGSGKICFQAYDFSNIGARVVQSTTIPAINTWYHVALVRTSGSVKLYVNGTLESTGTFAGTVNFNNNNGTRIGHSILDGANGYLNGSIGPLRITKGVARYTSNFTPPTGLFPTS